MPKRYLPSKLKRAAKRPRRGPRSPRGPVQRHGFSLQDRLLRDVYGATAAELRAIPYTAVHDLPARLNRLDGCGVSVKTSKSLNTVCMADCLRLFDWSGGRERVHMTVLFYRQLERTKRVVSAVEVDLTGSRRLLFGGVSRAQLAKLDALVKAVPQGRRPTPAEHAAMYAMRNSLQRKMGALQLNIKCNSTQSRLQCSFNRFQRFLSRNGRRVVARSRGGSFRGVRCCFEVASRPRAFRRWGARVRGRETTPAPSPKKRKAIQPERRRLGRWGWGRRLGQ